MSLYPSLDTPSVLVDLDKLETNITAMAAMTAEAGLTLRPHTKVHKGTYVSQLQMEAGAAGVSISKISEAAVYARAGIDDITVVHPFYGDHKLAMLRDILPQTHIRCVVDSLEGAKALGQVGQATGKNVPVLLKVDTGTNRFGVIPGQATLKMARELIQIPGIVLVGLLNHESVFNESSAEGVTRLTLDSAQLMCDTARLLKKEGIPTQDVATGSTATAPILCHHANRFPEITELHPGAYVFGDWKYIHGFGVAQADCAATVLVTVISTPNSGWACIDGGQKSFSADPLLFVSARAGQSRPWQPVYGSVKDWPEIKLSRLSEEVGILSLNSAESAPKIGDRLEIVPNHIALTINLHDKLYGVRQGQVACEIPVPCRGLNY